jgi:glycosyltransferase involved in cell wall biosynthesis
VNEAPCVTVVVPTRDRSSLLPRLVDHIAHSVGVDDVELVVVDDSSTDDTIAVLQSLQRSTPLTMRVLHTSRASGAGAARNIGWRSAQADVVVFTDDDCRPDEHWLEQLLRGFESADIVQGRTTFDPDEALGAGPFSQVVSVESFSGQFETSNIAYRRSVLEAVGGFDEHFGGDSYGEDVDLGWRAIEHGANATFVAEAVVVHEVKRDTGWNEFVASVRAARRWRHIGKVIRQHPGYRPHRLHRDPFLAPTHPPTLLALAGLVTCLLTRRRALGLLLVVPWVHHRVVKEPRPGTRKRQLVILPATFIVDAVETLTVTASGIRYQTLVL